MSNQGRTKRRVLLIGVKRDNGRDNGPERFTAHCLDEHIGTYDTLREAGLAFNYYVEKNKLPVSLLNSLESLREQASVSNTGLDALKALNTRTSISNGSSTSKKRGKKATHDSTKKLTLESTEQATKEDEMSVFLTNIGLIEYCDILVDNGFETLKRLPLLDDAVLQNIGMKKSGHRRHLLKAIATEEKKSPPSSTSNTSKKGGKYKTGSPPPLTPAQQRVLDEWFPKRCTTSTDAPDTFSIGVQMRVKAPNSYNNHCKEMKVEPITMRQFNVAIRQKMSYANPKEQPMIRHNRKRCFDGILFDCCSGDSTGDNTCGNNYCPKKK